MVAPDIHFLAVGTIELGRIGVVKDLAARQRRVAVAVEELKERLGRIKSLRGAEPGRKRVDAGRRRPQPGEHLVRDGLHSGLWQWALVNRVPRAASRSIWGV